MKELHPKAYDLLSRVRVPSHAAGEPGALYTPFPASGYPVLRHDAGGLDGGTFGGVVHEGIEAAVGGEGDSRSELVQVRWNNDDRSVMRGLKADVVEEWYDAVRLWNKCLTSPDSEYWVQLQPGTAVGAFFFFFFSFYFFSPFLFFFVYPLIIHNLVINNHRVLHGRSAFDGKRRMCGAYIGVDEYRSKLAVLRERFEGSSVADAVNPIVGTDSTLAAAATAEEEAPVMESGAGRSVWSEAL